MSELRCPRSRRMDLTEDVLGHQVSDPYRWLEDAGSGERADWLAAQAELYGVERDGWPGRDALTGQVRALLETGFVGTPTWCGERSFFTRRDPGQEHGVLYTRLGSGPAEVLVDPTAIDPSGVTTLDAWEPDKEGRLLAYQLSEGGDEESLLRILDVATGSLVDGPIDRCRYSNVAWLPGGKAFYYTRRLPPDQVPEGERQYHRRVYLHQLGTPADDDVLIFGTGRDKTDYYAVAVSRDGRWLAISAARGTAPRNDLWLADLSESYLAVPDLRVVQEGVDAQTWVRVGRDGLLYLFTDADAPRGRVAVADPAAADLADRASWRDLIREDPEAVLSGLALLDGPELDRPVLLATWARHALSEVTVHDLATGDRLGEVPLPGLGTAGGLSERPEGGHEAWFGYTDYVTPPVILRFDARTWEVTTWAVPPGSVAVPAVATRQVTYASADGTPVRMLIISPAAASEQQDGPNGPDRARPAILTGYGGFDISLTPAFSPNALAWVSAGGVYAVANLRGGSEEGEQWHRAGMLDRKQNVFDDFHAAAEALIRDGWTTPGQLAISGGSNGGLLVGAALTQRPELYAAVVCSAPLLDMVRYERFGLGQTWNVEYGTAADPEQLGWLLAYSPYHHVVPGTAYPAVLFTVFTNDTRVDPVHAYKMCAALQDAASPAPDSPGGRPVLMRAEGQVGHGARAVSRSAELAGDTLAFAARYTGLVLE
ncbi:MAG: prolyl oligopeptidase family serine peptidase [Streptosporangiaceae bacterium]